MMRTPSQPLRRVADDQPTPADALEKTTMSDNPQLISWDKIHSLLLTPFPGAGGADTPGKAEKLRQHASQLRAALHFATQAVADREKELAHKR